MIVDQNKKRFIKPVLIGIATIVALGIGAKVINDQTSDSSVSVQPSNTITQLTQTLEKEKLEFKEVNRKEVLNTKEWKHKFYSEAYLFHHLSYAEEINKYCAGNVVSSAIALANCNTAAKMSNTLYLTYFALSDDYARPNILMLLGMLLTMLVVVKALFKGLYLRGLQRQANPVASSVTGVES